MTKTNCSLSKLIYLGFDDSNFTLLENFNMIAPFFNEISNVLTLSKVLNLYPHLPGNKLGELKKMFFDLVALLGIISNVATYTSKYNYSVGLLKGVLLLIFTFLIPNLFMDEILSITKDNTTKLVFGLIIIYLLDLGVNVLFCHLKKKLDNDKYKKKTK